MKETLVIADSMEAMDAHQGLFKLRGDVYKVFPNGEPVRLMNEGIDRGVFHLHISAGWSWVVRMAVWKDAPLKGDILLMLTDAGLKRDEVSPFAEAAPEDIFPSLYYGRRFDVLRRLCRKARENIEKHLRGIVHRADVHLVNRDINQIVASSL